MTSKRLVGRMAVLITVGASMVLVAACGSSSKSSSGGSGSSSSSCTNGATAIVNKYKGPVGWVSPGPKFSTKSLKGKTIYWISLNADIPFTQDVFAGFKEAANAVGVHFVFFNGAGNASTETQGIEQAIAAHA